MKANELKNTQDNVVVMWLGDQSNDYALVNDLKRLVESHELVEKLGGIDAAEVEAGSYYTSESRMIEISQAIADVESCQ